MTNKYYRISIRFYISILILGTILFYGMGSFWFASFNIAKWSEDARGVMGYLWLILFIIWTIFFIVDKVEKK